MRRSEVRWLVREWKYQYYSLVCWDGLGCGEMAGRTGRGGSINDARSLLVLVLVQYNLRNIILKLVFFLDKVQTYNHVFQW